MVLTGAMSELYNRESRPRLDARLWLECRLKLAHALAEELNIGDIPRTVHCSDETKTTDQIINFIAYIIY